jgi:hypothetical protein
MKGQVLYLGTSRTLAPKAYSLEVDVCTHKICDEIGANVGQQNKLSRSAFFDEKSIPFHKQFTRSS